ncbi:hypothetical protein CAEBREN_24202 [Caenorhabditis brenneri]|uniref:Uncharacterized protein n=1 Tax=Caenorhabditis brenneri TaxID=135651 RepID=G0M849_CAEBE|nr:hypothetical protein CAEBREN_24202 [Caenorhabditis brenneri]
MPREPYNVLSFQHYFVPSRKKKVGEPENSEEFPLYIHARIVPKELEKEFRKWGTKREDLEIVYESQLTEQQIQRYAISSYDIGFLPRWWIDPNFMAWKAPCILLDCRHYVIPEHLEKEFRDLGMEDYGKTKYLFETKLSEEMKANTYFRPDIDEALAYYDPVYHQQIIDKYGLEEVVTVKAVTPEVVESNDKKDYENKTEDYEIGTEDHVKEDNVYEETSDDEYEENISASPDAGNWTYSDGFGDTTSLNDSVLTDHNKWLANRKNYRSNPDWASHFQEKPQTRNDWRSVQEGCFVLKRIPRYVDPQIDIHDKRHSMQCKQWYNRNDSSEMLTRNMNQGPAERYSRNDFPISPRHGTSSQQSDHTGFRETQRFPISHERSYNPPTVVQNVSMYNRNNCPERLSRNMRNLGIPLSQEVGYSTYSRGGSSRYTDQSPDEGYHRNDLLRQETPSQPNDNPRFRGTQRLPISHDQGPAERHRHDLLRQETSSHQNDYPGYSGRQRYPNSYDQSPAERHRHDLLRQETSSHQNDYPGYSGRQRYPSSYDQGAGERHRRLDPLLIPLRNPPEIRDEDWETPVLSHIRRGPEAEEYVKIARKGTTRQFKEIDLDF